MPWKRLSLIAALLIVLGAGGYAIWQSNRSAELPQGFAGSNGRIEAERIDVASKMAGRVAEVLVSEGQWVEAGELVARLDTAELDARLRQAKAAVAQAEQQKLQAEALSKQRVAMQEYAQAEFTRTDKLAAQGYASQEKLDLARAALIAAEAGVAEAAAGIELAIATIASANASVAQLESVLADAELTAPHEGRVQYLLKKAGEIVAAGGTVATMTDLTDIYMTIFLPAGDAAMLAIGSEARIVLDPIPQYVIPASVTFVASGAQFTPKSVETSDEREQLMFRVKLTIPRELLEKHQKQAKAGVAGMGYVRLDPSAEWPDELAVKLPQ